MPPTLSQTRGTLLMSQRPADVHPGQWLPDLDRLNPFAQFPISATLDMLKEGKHAESVRVFWWTKAFNALTGGIDDVFTGTDLGTPYASGPAAVGTTVVIKPDTADIPRLYNIRPGMQAVIHSATVHAQVSVLVTGCSPDGVAPSFTVQVIGSADTAQVLESTELTWGLLVDSKGEIFELDTPVNEHEENEYNYLYTDSESFGISRRELREYSRILEDKKKERELDALSRIYQRREFNILEGTRLLSGDKYYPGGLRYFLENNEPANIVDWRTDHNRVDADPLSSAGDSALGETLNFIRRFMDQRTRPYSRIGAKKQLQMSAFTRSFIDECVAANGEYKIEWSTNKYGIRVGTLGVLDAEVELVENTLFNFYPAYKRSIYVMETEQIQRHTPTGEEMGSKREKGLEYIPWSTIKKMDGGNFISRIMGAYNVEETYTFRRLPAHGIIRNIGLTKAA